MIGLAGLYIEIKSPGFGVPGLLGILCLGVLFSNQYLMGLADHTELMIIVLGFILLTLEVFVVPGFGLTGIGGIVCIAIGMTLAFQSFTLPSPELPWQKQLFIRNFTMILSSSLAAIIGSLLFMRYVIPRLGSVTDGPYLQTSLSNSHADSLETKTVKIGDRGISSTILRPAGKMRYGKYIIDVVTQGGYIAQETQVKVIAIDGNRVIVEEAF